MFDANANFTAENVSAEPIGVFGATKAKQSVEEVTVAATTGMLTPFAMFSEAQQFWRKSRGLGMRWSAELAKCRTAPEMIAVNARFGERAMALSYTGAWRVMERSAELARRSVAPTSFKMRNGGSR